VAAGNAFYWHDGYGPTKTTLDGAKIWEKRYFSSPSARQWGGTEVPVADLANNRIFIDGFYQDGDAPPLGGYIREHAVQDGKLICELDLGEKCFPTMMFANGKNFLVVRTIAVDPNSLNWYTDILKLSPP
jgi:hypothetical protein